MLNGRLLLWVSATTDSEIPDRTPMAGRIVTFGKFCAIAVNKLTQMLI